MSQSHEASNVTRERRESPSPSVRLATVVMALMLSALAFAAFTASASADVNGGSSDGDAKNLGLVVVDDSLNGNDVLSNNALNACVIAKCEAESKEITVNGGSSDGDAKNLGLVVVDDSLNGNDVLSNNALNACVIAKCEAESKEITVNGRGDEVTAGTDPGLTTSSGGSSGGGIDGGSSAPPANDGVGNGATSENTGTTPGIGENLAASLPGSVDRRLTLGLAGGAGGSSGPLGQAPLLPLVMGAQVFSQFTPPSAGDGGLADLSTDALPTGLSFLSSTVLGLVFWRRLATMGC